VILNDFFHCLNEVLRDYIPADTYHTDTQTHTYRHTHTHTHTHTHMLLGLEK
jgi:hypothetical protein